MTSAFRTRIAQRVLSTIEDSLTTNNLSGPERISPLLRMNRFGRNVPALKLPWHNLVNLNPQLEESMDPKSLIKALRNQGLPNSDGVTDITFDNSPPKSILFTLDGRIFTKAVLMDLCVNLDVIAFKSCNFHGIVPKNVVIECSSSKLGKPLDMGNFRSMIYGNFIANIHQFVGHKVTRINSIEDWGLPYGLLIAGYEEFGHEDQLEEHPNFHLSEVLKAAFEKCKRDSDFTEKAKLYFKRMEEGDVTILSTLEKLRKPCLKEFLNTYKQLGMEFDEMHCDSLFTSNIAGLQQNLIEKQLMDIQQDAPSEDVSQKNAFSEDFYSPTYSMARNICAAVYRKNRYDFDDMYFVANSSQKIFFELLLNILEAMGHDWHRNIHHIKLQDFRSQKSKSKKPLIDEVLHTAKVSVLKDIRQSITPRIEQDIDDIAGVLSSAALIVDGLHRRKNRDYTFDLNDCLRMTANSGITLQLCHSSLSELIESSGVKMKFDDQTSTLTQAEAINLVRHLSRFDEIIYKAYYTMEPCIILQYLVTLSYLVEKAVATLSVNIKENRLAVVKARLLLFHATRNVFQKGLELLGIKPLERF